MDEIFFYAAWEKENSFPEITHLYERKNGALWKATEVSSLTLAFCCY